MVFQLGVCLSGFQNIATEDVHLPFNYIIGDNLLRRFVSIFDMENKRIGFKPLGK